MQINMALKLARIKAGMTIEQVSEISGHTPGTISKTERGETSPSIATVESILAAINPALELRILQKEYGNG